jgi:putative colanic acid biosynthesis acetyltransferase WcaF
MDLSKFSRHRFGRGRGLVVVCLWSALAPLGASWFLPSRWRVWLLRLFGAQIGNGVLIKAHVRVRYPWRLRIGEHSWIGDGCWIDNWAPVTIGKNVCLSQSAYLCTGNHDWSDPSFAIAPQPITIGDGVWVGAHAVLGPGVQMGTGSIAAIGSVVTRSIPDWEIHAGNPSTMQRVRLMRSSNPAEHADDRILAR